MLFGIKYLLIKYWTFWSKMSDYINFKVQWNYYMNNIKNMLVEIKSELIQVFNKTSEYI